MNLLKGFTNTNIPSHPTFEALEDSDLTARQTLTSVITMFSIVIFMWYSITSMLYWGALVSRTDNIMESQSLDLKFSPAFNIVMKMVLLLLSAITIFFDSITAEPTNVYDVSNNQTSSVTTNFVTSTIGKENLVYVSISVPGFLALVLSLLFLWWQPCSILSYNYVRATQFLWVTWAAITGGYSH